MGFNRMPKLLRLGRADKLEALFANLHFMPGHRLKFLNLLEEERTRAQQEAAYDSAALFYGGAARVSTQAHAKGIGSRPASRGRSAGRGAGGSRGRGQSAGIRPAPGKLAGPPLPLASKRDGLHGRESSPEREGGEDVDPTTPPPIDAESAAVAFFQLSWVQAMLAAKDGEATLLPTLREEEGSPSGEGSAGEAGAGAAGQAGLGRGTGSDDEEEYESDFDSEDEAAATLRATLRASLSLQATARGWKEVAKEAATAPSPGGGPAGARAGGGGATEATAQAVLRVLEQQAAAEESSKTSAVLTPSSAASQPAANAVGASGPRGSGRGGLLANSLGSFAPPSGVLWRPDPSEIVEAVAFVLAKQIEEEGRVLLLRTMPPTEAQEGAGGECAEDAGSAQPTQGGTRRADQGRRSIEEDGAGSAGGGFEQNLAALHDGRGEPHASACGGTGAAEFSTVRSGSGEASSGRSVCSQTDSGDDSEEIELPGSPPPSAGFCRALLRAQDALDGLRYSLELSPIVEAHRRGGSASPHASLDAMADTATWAGAWQPPESLRCLFDEALHPLPFDKEGRGLNGRPHPLAWSNPSVAQVSGFLKQIAGRARMGAEASVVGLAYVERFVSVSGRPIDPRSWRRAVLTAWLLAAKMWDDDCYESHDFAQLLELDGAPHAAVRLWGLMHQPKPIFGPASPAHPP